jgi:recombination protein RecT
MLTNLEVRIRYASELTSRSFGRCDLADVENLPFQVGQLGIPDDPEIQHQVDVLNGCIELVVMDNELMGAISKATEAQTEARKQPSLAQVATDRIEKVAPRFQAVLPRGWDMDRFKNLVLTCVKREPNLIKCFNTAQGEASLIVAALQCAAIGLEPNTPLKEASLVPRKNKGVEECQLMIEYRGLIKLARRSGEISTITAEVVRERDEFRYSMGLDPTLHHVRYDGEEDPGELTHCYAVCVFKDGGEQFVVLSRREVYTEHRAKSDSWRNEAKRQFSPWTQFEPAMWRKTAVRALEPFLPLTAEAAVGFDSDERTLIVDDGVIVPAGEIIDVDDAGPIEHEPDTDPPS